MDILKSRGIVLNKKEINEADIFTTVFTGSFGKISASAFGIRNSRRRSLADLSPLSIVNITFHKKNDYYIVADTELVKTFRSILKDIGKLETALYILDSVNRIYDRTYENEDFFYKLERILDYIENIEELKKGYKYYIIITFLRRMMLEHGIFDVEGLNRRLGSYLAQIYSEISVFGKTLADNMAAGGKLESYALPLKDIAVIFERYVNENLQVRLEIKKIITEDL